MAHSLLKLVLSRRFLPVAVLFSFVLFTGAMFIQPVFHSSLLPADVARVSVVGTNGAFPVQRSAMTQSRNPVLQRMEEMILTERMISVSV